MSERTIVRIVSVLIIGLATLVVLPVLYFTILEIIIYAKRDTATAERIAQEKFKACKLDFRLDKVVFNGPVLQEARNSSYTFVWTAEALGPEATARVYVGYLPFSVDCFISDRLDQVAEPRAQNPFNHR
jgi:hypothetical protein